jgi:hypothetical protein
MRYHFVFGVYSAMVFPVVQNLVVAKLHFFCLCAAEYEVSAFRCLSGTSGSGADVALCCTSCSATHIS